jgi:hypothetical protein
MATPQPPRAIPPCPLNLGQRCVVPNTSVQMVTRHATRWSASPLRPDVNALRQTTRDALSPAVLPARRRVFVPGAFQSDQTKAFFFISVVRFLRTFLFIASTSESVTWSNSGCAPWRRADHFLPQFSSTVSCLGLRLHLDGRPPGVGRYRPSE